MSEPDLNLLIALDALLADASVAGAARRLGLSESAMSRTLTRLRAATGDPLLVRAGRQMVLTPYAEEIRERTRRAAHEARAVLRPSPKKLDLSISRRTFTIRANDGFVAVLAAPLIAAAQEVAPLVRLRFAQKPEKSARHLREGLADLEIGVLGEMGPEVRVQTLFRDQIGFQCCCIAGRIVRRHTEASGIEQWQVEQIERNRWCWHADAGSRQHQQRQMCDVLWPSGDHDGFGVSLQIGGKRNEIA